MAEGQWISMRDVCEYLGTSNDSVAIWIKTRNFPGVKVNGIWRFKLSDVDAWTQTEDAKGTRFKRKLIPHAPLIEQEKEDVPPKGREQAISFKPLFKLLIDKEMKKKELAEKANISMATITKMGKIGCHVNTDVLERICLALDCKIEDIIEIVYVDDIRRMYYDHLESEPISLDNEACKQYGLSPTEKELVHFIYEQLQYYRDNPPAYMVHQAKMENGLKSNEEAKQYIPTDRYYSLVLNDVIDQWGRDGMALLQRGVSISIIESGFFEIADEENVMTQQLM